MEKDREIDVLNYGKVDPATVAKMASKGGGKKNTGPLKLNVIPPTTRLMLRGNQFVSSTMLFLVAFGMWEVKNDMATGAALFAGIVVPMVLCWYITTLKW